MLIGARTLSLVIGFGHLVFALLVTAYTWQAKKSNPALDTWRCAKTLLNLGFFTNLTSPEPLLQKAQQPIAPANAPSMS